MRRVSDDGAEYETVDGERVERESQQWCDEERREMALTYKAALAEVREDEVYQRRKAEWTEK